MHDITIETSEKEREGGVANLTWTFFYYFVLAFFNHLGFRLDDFRDNYQRDAEERAMGDGRGREREKESERETGQEERTYKMNLYA